MHHKGHIYNKNKTKPAIKINQIHFLSKFTVCNDITKSSKHSSNKFCMYVKMCVKSCHITNLQKYLHVYGLSFTDMETDDLF